MALKHTTAAAYTMEFDGLGSAQARSGVAVTVDTTKNVVDVQFKLKIVLAAGSPAGNKQCVVYAYGSADGTEYGNVSGGGVDNVDGTSKLLSGIGNPSILIPVAYIPCLTASSVITTQPISIAGAFPYGIPPKVGIVLHNDLGVALGSGGDAEVIQVYYDLT